MILGTYLKCVSKSGNTVVSADLSVPLPCGQESENFLVSVCLSFYSGHCYHSKQKSRSPFTLLFVHFGCACFYFMLGIAADSAVFRKKMLLTFLLDFDLSTLCDQLLNTTDHFHTTRCSEQLLNLLKTLKPLTTELLL